MESKQKKQKSDLIFYACASALILVNPFIKEPLCCMSKAAKFSSFRQYEL